MEQIDTDTNNPQDTTSQISSTDSLPGRFRPPGDATATGQDATPTDNERPESDREAEARKSREEASQLADNALGQLDTALAQGRSESLRSWLTLLSRFHKYSLNNTILIYAQNPEATHVASYHRWKDLGRHVKRDEKGIAIWSPTFAKKTIELEGPGGEVEEKTVSKLTGFRIAKVFDVAQTEGDELPEFVPISGDPGENLTRLEKLLKENNIEISYRYPSSGALGMSSGGKITVRPDLKPAEKFSVAVHEFAHEILHQGEREYDASKTVVETEAEAVAFTVCHALGLDSTTRSSDYIQLYRGNRDTLKESLACIHKTASEIIQRLTPYEPKGATS